MRGACLSLLVLGGCAPWIWDARQIACDAETDEIVVSSGGALPLWLFNTDDVDEDCEVKTVGIRFAAFEDDDGIIEVSDADEVDFEIDPAVFGEDGTDYPKLDVAWEDAMFVYDEDNGEFNRIDLSYGPSLPLLVLESDGAGRMSYGQDTPGFNASEPEADDLFIDCENCYVNARVASSFHIEMDRQPDERGCVRQSSLSGDLGFCTFISASQLLPDDEETIPASSICIESGIAPDAEIVVDAGDANVKVIVFPGAEPGRIRIVADRTVAFYSPDLGYTGSVVDGTVGTLPLSPLGGSGPVLEIEGASVAGIFEETDPEGLEVLCQVSRREVVTDGEDDGDGEDD